MLFLLGVLVNCVAWLLSSMLGGTQINQQNVYGKLSSSHHTTNYSVTETKGYFLSMNRIFENAYS